MTRAEVCDPAHIVMFAWRIREYDSV